MQLFARRESIYHLATVSGLALAGPRWPCWAPLALLAPLPLVGLLGPVARWPLWPMVGPCGPAGSSGLAWPGSLLALYPLVGPAAPATLVGPGDLGWPRRLPTGRAGVRCCPALCSFVHYNNNTGHFYCFTHILLTVYSHFSAITLPLSILIPSKTYSPVHRHRLQAFFSYSHVLPYCARPPSVSSIFFHYA